MRTRPEGQSDSDGHTLEFAAVVDPAGSDFAKIARSVRRRSAVRRTGETVAEFAKETPELVIELIEGLLP